MLRDAMILTWVKHMILITGDLLRSIHGEGFIITPYSLGVLYLGIVLRLSVIPFTKHNQTALSSILRFFTLLSI